MNKYISDTENINYHIVSAQKSEAIIFQPWGSVTTPYIAWSVNEGL